MLISYWYDYIKYFAFSELNNYIIKINFICYFHFLNRATITFKITYVLK